MITKIYYSENDCDVVSPIDGKSILQAAHSSKKKIDQQPHTKHSTRGGEKKIIRANERRLILNSKNRASAR
jgi:hypothetical protein